MSNSISSLPLTVSQKIGKYLSSKDYQRLRQSHKSLLPLAQTCTFSVYLNEVAKKLAILNKKAVSKILELTDDSLKVRDYGDLFQLDTTYINDDSFFVMLRLGQNKELVKASEYINRLSDIMFQISVDCLDIDDPKMQQFIIKFWETGRIRDYQFQNAPIRFFSAIGRNDIVMKLLENPKVDPTAKDHAALMFACSLGHKDVTFTLLNDKRVNAAYCQNAAFRMACEGGHLDIVEMLMNHPSVDPYDLDCDAIVLAAKNGHFEIVKLLMANNRKINPGAGDNALICCACKYGAVEIYDKIICDFRVDPSAWNNYGLIEASKNGHVDIVHRLLHDDRVNPAAQKSQAFIEACGNGHLDIAKLLIEDNRINPGAQNNSPIRFAARNGHTEIVKLLLHTDGVDPTVKRSHPIRLAAQHGYLDMVKVLSQDDRVNCIAALHAAVTKDDIEMCRYLFNHHCDPTENANLPLRTAAEYGRTEIVKLLLEYPQVNPCDANFDAIKLAAQNHHFDVLNLLVNDPRIKSQPKTVFTKKRKRKQFDEDLLY